MLQYAKGAEAGASFPQTKYKPLDGTPPNIGSKIDILLAINATRPHHNRHHTMFTFEALRCKCGDSTTSHVSASAVRDPLPCSVFPQDDRL